MRSWDNPRWKAEFEALMEQTRKRLRENPNAEQVIGVKTTKGNLRFVISRNITSGDFREENAFFQILQESNDTEVLCFVTMWHTESVDMCSRHFSTTLLRINPKNQDAMTLLQGPGKYLAKPLKQLLPPEQTERKSSK